MSPTSVAVVSCKLHGAVTRVTVDAVYTRLTVFTCVINTIIDVCRIDMTYQYILQDMARKAKLD